MSAVSRAPALSAVVGNFSLQIGGGLGRACVVLGVAEIVKLCAACRFFVRTALRVGHSHSVCPNLEAFGYSLSEFKKSAGLYLRLFGCFQSLRNSVVREAVVGSR